MLLRRKLEPLSRILKTCHNCVNARVRNETETACLSPIPSHLSASIRAPNTEIVIRKPYLPTSSQWRRARIGSPGLRGGCFMTFLSPSPTPSASAGNTSLTRLRNRICKGRIGNGRFTIVAEVTTIISLTLHEIR